MNTKPSVDKILDDLRTQRDELRVRMHLAKAEVREEWESLEKQWQHVESKLERTAGAAKDSAEDVGAALSQVAEELGAAYKRIRKTLR